MRYEARANGDAPVDAGKGVIHHHGNLLARGHTARANRLAAMATTHEGTASLIATAGLVSRALGTVPPDEAFLHDLGAELVDRAARHYMLPMFPVVRAGACARRHRRRPVAQGRSTALLPAMSALRSALSTPHVPGASPDRRSLVRSLVVAAVVAWLAHVVTRRLLQASPRHTVAAVPAGRSGPV